jgi:two-component system CheB/CheR fusion protein
MKNARRRRTPSDSSATPSQVEAPVAIDRFPIVGVGASAGGLEAFTRLLEHLPLDVGLGVVLVQHLDPEHESALCQILSRATRLVVEEIVDGQRVEPNRIHVIPRDTTLSIVRGVLRLQPRERTRVPHRPIDTFFEALAQDCGERAIGVVLSGTGSDGTVGLEAIKAEGGITFAQDSSARHESMPRSAVAAGCVDLVLSPAEIAKELARIASHPYVALSGAGRAGDAVAKTDGAGLRGELDRAEATAHEDDPTPLPSGGHVPDEPALFDRNAAPSSPDSPETLPASGAASNADDGYKRILALLRSHSGVDFSLYKSTTIRRRIARRMILTKHDTPLNYAAYLRGNGKELDALYSDVLISVTSFFRNPETFDVLQHSVLPALLDIRSDDPLRCWVLGCSTGQEAYSIAMAFVEVAENAPHTRRLQIFATDLNESLLDKARHGLYARSLEQDISPERLRRFFVEEEGGYRVVKSLREMVVFARQNLIADPPFSRMDVISCRNLLIYLEPILQQKAMPTFHYALKPTGFLLLGASESIGSFTDLFEPLDKKHKIYTRKPAPTPALHLAATRSRPADSAARAMLPMRSVARYEASDEFRGSELTAQREADRVTVNQFAPPGVLVDAQLQILQFRGPTGAFLEPPAGKASFDVLKMAREGLMLPLRAAIEEARRDSKSVRRDNVQIRQDGSTRTVTLDVVPLKNLREPCFLILFDDSRSPWRARSAGEASSRKPVIGKRQEPGRITELETELTETRDFLMSVQEQHEAANEELQAANEEVQSANEELQSVNEELETSKEELESANEELITVNEEMSHRNVELNRLNADLLNLQLATGLAIILVGRDLAVRRFSPQAQKQFDLLPTDVGRPIGHLRHHLVQDSTNQPVDLERLAADVVGSLTELDQQVRDISGRWFSLRIRPYLTLDNRVDGAALVWFDVDALKRTETTALAARDFAENTIATVREPLLVVDRHFRIESANSAFYRVFRLTPAQSVGESLLELMRWHWDAERVRGLLEDAFSGNAPVEDVAVAYTSETGDQRQLQFTARRIMGPAGTRERVLLVIEDVTERVRAEEAMARLAAIVTSSEDAIISKSLDGIIVTWNRAAERLFRYAEWEVIGKPASQLIPEDRRAEEPEILGRIRQGEIIEHFETVRRRKDGSTLPISLTMSPLLDAGNRVTGVSMVARDITDRKAGEEQLARQVAQFEALLNQSPFGVFLVDADLRLRHMSALARDMLADVPALPGSGLDVFDCLWPQFAGEAVKQRFMETLATGERYVASADVEAHPERETITFYDWQISRIAMPDGRNGVVCFFQDVSARVRSQRQIIELVTALQNGDRLKDEFLAMLAHELRGPLAPLGNMLEVMKRARGNADMLDTVHDSMQRQVGQLMRLVDDLLDINRIKRGQIELRRERIDLVPVLRQAIAACQPICERAGHALTVSIPPEPLWVSGDPARLAQVFGNLLNNACKYTASPGRIDLAVGIEGGEVVVKVQDNGIGIAADMLSSIFDMFVQADDARERAQGGLGLGLALARRLVECTKAASTCAARDPAEGPSSACGWRGLNCAPRCCRHRRRQRRRRQRRRCGSWWSTTITTVPTRWRCFWGWTVMNCRWPMTAWRP